MALISSNEYLSVSEMTDNAKYIYTFFKNLGWTANAICGMLGNMQRESTLNPGVWQSLDYENYNGGFGLVQWTPATNLTNWASQRGLDRDSIETQCLKIQDEYNTGGAIYSNRRLPSNVSTIFKIYRVSRISGGSILQKLRTCRGGSHGRT